MIKNLTTFMKRKPDFVMQKSFCMIQLIQNLVDLPYNDEISKNWD